MFARVWILVEGETDETVIQEAARILGHDLFAMGVCCFKFTELGIEPYIKLADALGIHWIAVADNDPAGQGYIATAQVMLAGRLAADHIVMLPAWDIETYLCISGYFATYQNSANPQKVIANPNPFVLGTADYWKHLVNKQQPGKGKPARVIQVMDEIEAQGAAGVPPFFGTLVGLAQAKAHEGI